MSAYIFPRLTIGGSHVRRKEMGTAAVDHLEKSVVYKHRMDPGAGRAGQPVPRERLEHIRAGILDISSRVYGYPSNMPSNRVGDWDADVGLWLVEQAAIPLSEARSAEVWSFLCLCVLPDVVAWRWRMDPKLMMSDLKNRQLDRFHGGARNTFQRLWLRTHVLLNPEDTDPVRLIRRMPEDALVQVFERPHLSASPVVARTIVEVGVEMHDCVPSSEREDLHRQAVKLLRARAAVRVLEILSPEALRAVVIKAYHDAAGRPLRAPAV